MGAISQRPRHPPWTIVATDAMWAARTCHHAQMHVFALVTLLGACPTEPVAAADSGTASIPPDQTATVTRPASGTPPGPPAISIIPVTPVAGGAFAANIITPSADVDGDAVTYRYAWTQNGVLTDIQTAEVSSIATVDFDIWEVTVTPNDGRFDGTPVQTSVTIGNAPPSGFAVQISPENPTDGDELSVIVDPMPVDPEGDPLTTTITWYDDDAYMPELAGLTTVDGKWVSDQEVFRVVVTVTDGFHPVQTAEASVLVTYTCENLPPFNQGATTLSDATGYKGLAFDTFGNLVGYDARNSLIQSARDGSQNVFAPGVGLVQQIDRLPDGDLVFGDSTAATLVRAYSNGATTVMATDMANVYGVTVGPDGMVWAVTTRGVVRVDPDTGESETMVAAERGYTMHSIAFNLDSTVLFIGVIGSSNIYQVSLDSDLNPTGGPTVYASGVGGGYHDGIGLDVCGNLYVADYTTSGLYRVETDGTVTSMVTTNYSEYGHGVTWGESLGGWDPLALYQPQPYNGYTVREVLIGFASGDTVRTWNGVAVPY